MAKLVNMEEEKSVQDFVNGLTEEELLNLLGKCSVKYMNNIKVRTFDVLWQFPNDCLIRG